MTRADGEGALVGVDEEPARARLGDTEREQWEGPVMGQHKAAVVEAPHAA
jgi:hypothetical protein